jgi:transposase-like protein
MIDWIWVSKEICLIIYYDYINKKIIRFWFYDWERYKYIKNDLKVLRDEFKYEIICFVVDWGKQIKKAIEEIYPNAKIQRCLTHICRQIKTNISNNPQSECWKGLQKIITFKNFKNEELFIRKFKYWEEKYFDFLKERSFKWYKYWYTHRKLRASRSHIRNAIPYMFHYLYDENIKRSSNDLEWLNWLISDQIKNHRWLRIDRLISFISLWIYERNLR